MENENSSNGQQLKTILTNEKSLFQSESKGFDTKDTETNCKQAIANNEFKDISTEGGAFVIGEQNNFSLTLSSPNPNPEKILKLIEKYRDLSHESSEFKDLVEYLDDYQQPRPGRKIIGLENKLIAGNRSEDLEDAAYLKSRFAKRLARHQLSSHHMAVHKYLLSQVNERFRSLILPYIRENYSKPIINTLISERVIQPFVDELLEADPSIDADIIHGMIYFLTGNCHIEWA